MLQFPWRFITVSGLISATLVSGCGQPTSVTGQQESAGLQMPTGIAQIMRQPVAIATLSAEQNNDTVQVAGTVIRQAALLSGSLYQLEDESGTIWIMSEEPPPERATTLRIVGTVQVESISVEGIDISDFYLREQTRTVTNEDTENTDENESSEPAETGDTDEETTP